MKDLFLFLIIIFSILEYNATMAQNYLPGVTSEIITSIKSRINSIKNDEYSIGYVLNVDSSLGFSLGPRWPEAGQIENPYGTLTNCYVFLANRETFSNSQDSAKGIIGIYKNGQIIWQSDNKIKNNVRNGFIWSIKDINRDGKVDIMTTWISADSWYILPSSGGVSSYVFLWIVSWDGTNGKILNQIGSEGESKIMISSNGIPTLADIEGDGIWEIQGDIFPETAEDSLKVTEESYLIPETFSWNGHLYGRWQNTPQPPYETSFPRDKIDVIINTKVKSSQDSLTYYYKIHNLNSSFQDINEFALRVKTTSLLYNFKKMYWSLVFFDSSISGRSFNIVGSNFIERGNIDSSLILKTSSLILPSISSFYLAGWNTNNYKYNEIFTNSIYANTIAPSDPPSPFIPLNFIDTLINYTDSSCSLGWITNELTIDKYDSLFTSAKTQLQQNNSNAAKTTLQTVLQQVDVGSTNNLTSEAYALLRYNTEYLINQIPEGL